MGSRRTFSECFGGGLIEGTGTGENVAKAPEASALDDVTGRVGAPQNRFEPIVTDVSHQLVAERGRKRFEERHDALCAQGRAMVGGAQHP